MTEGYGVALPTPAKDVAPIKAKKKPDEEDEEVRFPDPVPGPDLGAASGAVGTREPLDVDAGADNADPAGVDGPPPGQDVDRVLKKIKAQHPKFDCEVTIPANGPNDPFFMEPTELPDSHELVRAVADDGPGSAFACRAAS